MRIKNKKIGIFNSLDCYCKYYES